MRINSTIYNLSLGVLAFFLPLALYIKTLAPTYIPIYSAELALCMKFWGICHPPGFPLYILVGNLFTSIFPFETLIFKANFLSAVFAAGTILLVYLCLTELKVQRAIALLLALFLAVSAAFWEFSLSADVFTFGALLIALTFFLTFKNKPLWAFLALVLSASHFYISAILAPLLVWYFFRESEGQSIGESESQNHQKVIYLGIGIFIRLFPAGSSLFAHAKITPDQLGPCRRIIRLYLFCKKAGIRFDFSFGKSGFAV